MQANTAQTSPRSLTLLLVRHGETAHNAEGRIQGQTDTPLSDVGRAQAMATGLHLRGCFHHLPAPLLPVPLFVFTSDLARASETAEIVCRAAGVAVPILNRAGLRERHYGDWQGLLVSEIAVHRRTLADPPGGETEAEVYARMMRTFADLWRETDTGAQSTVALVVGHGGSLRALLCRALDVSGTQQGRFRLENCAISVLEFSGTDVQSATGRIVRANDGGHLRAADLAAQTLAV